MQQLPPMPSPSLPPPPPPTTARKLRFYRLVTLTSLLFTDGTYTLLRRYSRGVLNETYSVNDVLLVAEIIKLSFSCYMISRGTGTSEHGGGGDDNNDDAENETLLLASSKARARKPTLMTFHYLVNLLLRSKKMLLLALIYGVGNVLSYYALAQIGAGTFVVIANLKALSTAWFSVAMLGRTYSWTKWRALILLVVGVILFTLPTLEDDDHDVVGGNDNDVDKDRLLVNIEESSKDNNEEHTGEDDDESFTEKNLGYNYYNTSIKSGIVLGVTLELVVVTLSGYAAIYFEKAIKNDPFNIWERNFQLGFYSILMYTVLILSDNSDKPFSNWTTMAHILSVLGAAGGLLVALSIKYGDSVLKTLAISGSIIYANIVDHIFLGGPLDEHMFLSAIIVVIAVLNYNFDAHNKLMDTMESERCTRRLG